MIRGPGPDALKLFKQGLPLFFPPSPFQSFACQQITVLISHNRLTLGQSSLIGGSVRNLTRQIKGQIMAERGLSKVMTRANLAAGGQLSGYVFTHE